MSRLTQSDEMHILNELSYLEEKLYKGLNTDADLVFTMKTIRNLLLEVYLIKQQLSPEQADEIDLHIKNHQMAADAAIFAYEANKPT